MSSPKISRVCNVVKASDSALTYPLAIDAKASGCAVTSCCNMIDATLDIWLLCHESTA